MSGPHVGICMQPRCDPSCNWGTGSDLCWVSTLLLVMFGAVSKIQLQPSSAIESSTRQFQFQVNQGISDDEKSVLNTRLLHFSTNAQSGTPIWILLLQEQTVLFTDSSPRWDGLSPRTPWTHPLCFLYRHNGPVWSRHISDIRTMCTLKALLLCEEGLHCCWFLQKRGKMVIIETSHRFSLVCFIYDFLLSAKSPSQNIIRMGEGIFQISRGLHKFLWTNVIIVWSVN